MNINQFIIFTSKNHSKLLKTSRKNRKFAGQKALDISLSCPGLKYSNALMRLLKNKIKKFKYYLDYFVVKVVEWKQKP